LSVRILNMLLRLATLASKFFLIFGLAYYLDPKEVGLYGVFFAAVSYSIYIIGFEFYVFSTRDIIPREKSEWGLVIKSHAAFVCTLYAISIPLICAIFVFDILPLRLVFWFFIILFFEHLAQEFNRLFVAASKQLIASMVLFIRSGLWGVVAIVLMYFDKELRSLEIVFVAWLICVMISCFFSFIMLFRLNLGGWKSAVDWKWVRKGVIIAFPFLLASLSTRGMFTFDRILMGEFSSLSVIGAYVLYVGMANALVSFLDAAVFVFTYPVLIKAFSEGDAVSFNDGMRKMVYQSTFVSIFFIVVAVLAVDPVLQLLGKSVYLENESIFYLLLTAMVLFVSGTIFQYGLYAQGKDKHIVYSSVSSLMVFFVFSLFVAQYKPTLAVPISLCVAFLVGLVWKVLIYIKETPREYLRLR